MLKYAISGKMIEMILANLFESSGSCCCHPDVSMGVGVTFKYYDKGKELSGELSCTWTVLVYLSCVVLSFPHIQNGKLGEIHFIWNIKYVAPILISLFINII